MNLASKLAAQIAALLPAAAALAQMGSLPSHNQPLTVSSGAQDGAGQGGTQERLAFAQYISLGGAWTRLHIGQANLGRASRLQVTSTQDGGLQSFDAASLAAWQNNSAVFNGPEVLVELFVAPEDTGVFATIDRATVGDWSYGERTVCGTDDRTRSSDNRVARFIKFDATGSGVGVGTAWLTSTGAFLTAGHCFDDDADGQRDPNNGYIVEFNVPSSNAAGHLVFANPDDQYTISNSQFTHDQSNALYPLGRDFAVFDTTQNSNTHQFPGQRQGFFRITTRTPVVGTNVRVTGYGVDTTPTDSLTQQTGNGVLLGHFTPPTSPERRYMSYQVDTEGGSSGGPIVDDAVQGYGVGIHTTSGCVTGVPLSANFGTSITLPDLGTMLTDFYGTGTEYCDRDHAYRATPIGSGSAIDPHDGIFYAVQEVPAGGRIVFTTGNYFVNTNAPVHITKAMSLRAPLGDVIIGR